MESLPARRAAQRRPSPERASLNNSPPRTASRAASPTRIQSETSQTLLIDATEPAQEQEDSQHEEVPSSLSDPQDDPSGTVKKCWICFADSTEDTPETSPWRDPCPCALVAHEACLLDWIADMESPSNRRTRNRGFSAPKIECPQCKKEIVLARPRSFIVDAVRRIERAGLQLTTPGALTVLVGLLYNGSMASGIHTIYAVFGAEDGSRILQPLLLNTIRPRLDLDSVTRRDLGRHIIGHAVGYLVHWRLYIGLPLITPTIVLSRTSFADSILPVLPVLFFATQSPSSHDAFDFGQWPPSASLAFALLPYLRSAYNFYYKKVWAAKEKQWLSEIQPRAREGDNQDAAINDLAPDDQIDDDDDENVVEVRIDGGLWEEWEDEEIDQAGQQHVAADMVDLDAQPIEFREVHEGDALQEVQADAPPDVAQERRNDQQPQNNAEQAAAPNNRAAGGAGPRRLSFSPTDVAETFLGSLIFPSIAGLSGQLLKLVLPLSWTTPSAIASGGRMRFAAKGLLQQKWGRSLVGGCLFVVLKDCVMLYVKWKMAQMHRQRTVLDYQGPRRLNLSPTQSSVR